MSRRIKTSLIISASVLVLASPMAALAATTTSTSDQATTTLAQRLAARQAALKTKLDAATTARIKLKCKAAQALVVTSKTKTQPNIEKRSDLYASIIERLQSIIDRLKLKGVDTTELGNVETQLQAAAAQYKSDLTAYDQSLIDIAGVECATDPAGFKATVDSMRAERIALAKDAAAVRTLQTALTKALANAKVALANKQNSSGSGN